MRRMVAMSDPLEHLRSWSLDRQRLSRPGDDPLAVLHDVIGVYATQPAGPLALRARVPGFDYRTIRRLEAERQVIRVGGMRGTGHLVPMGSSALVTAATARPMAGEAWRLRDAGIDRPMYERLRDAILAATDEPRSTRDLRALVGARIALAPVIQTMGLEGVLVPIAPDSPRSAALLHVSTEAWLGGLRPTVDPGIAVRWLVDEYLRAFGPARVEDIRWWIGGRDAAVNDAVAALDLIALDGGALLRRADLPSFEARRPVTRGRIDVLAMWDAYTMGYRVDGRARFVSADMQSRLFDTDGNGLGAVLVDGLAAAAWVARTVGLRLDVDLDPFERPSRRLDAGIRDAFEDVARVLELRQVSIRMAEGPLGRRVRRRRPGPVHVAD